MLIRLKFLNTFKLNWAITAIILFYIYLAAHALSGSQGLMRWVDYEDDIKYSNRALVALKQNRIELESRANELRTIGLDVNVLDVRAREKLYVSHPNDYVIFLDHTP